jgi:hypothetical protein
VYKIEGPNTTSGNQRKKPKKGAQQEYTELLTIKYGKH